MNKQKLKEIKHGIDGEKVDGATIGIVTKIKEMNMSTFEEKKE